MAVYKRFSPQREQPYISEGLVIQAWKTPNPQEKPADKSYISEGMMVRFRSNRRKNSHRAVSTEIREPPQLDKTIVSTPGPIIKPKRAKQQARTASLPKPSGVYLGCEDCSGRKSSRGQLPSMLMLRLIERPRRCTQRTEARTRPKTRLITLDCPPVPSPQHFYVLRKKHRNRSEDPLVATSTIKRSAAPPSFISTPGTFDQSLSQAISPQRSPTALHRREAEDYDPDYQFSMNSYYFS